MKKFDYYQASLNLQVFKKFIALFPDMTVNILLSFAMLSWEFTEFLETLRHLIGKIIFDCGAWSLNKAKAPNVKRLTVDNYIRYLKRYGYLFDFYFNFDDDFTSSGVGHNQYNQKLMEDAGLNPVPVVHNIYNNEIDQYIDAGYKIVALGSPQIKTQSDMAHVTRRFDWTGIDLHVLGKSGSDLLAHFPISSSDSAMWARKGGYGDICWLNPKKEGDDKTDEIYLEEYLSVKYSHKHLYFSYEFKDDLDAYLWHTFGLKYYDLFGEGNAPNKMLVNMYYYILMEEEINRMHQRFGFTGQA